MTRTLGALLAVALLSGCAQIPSAQGPNPSAVQSQASAAQVPVTTGLPPASAPGVTNPAVTQANIHQTICVSGWTATVRPPAAYTTSVKRRQMVALHLAGPTSAWEEDHRVPLSSGGAPKDEANLWPEPWDGVHGAYAKDVTEVRVLHDVCSGKATLAAAQAFWMGDFWTAEVP